MEIYEFGKASNKIVVALPFGENVKVDYHLTKFEEPV